MSTNLTPSRPAPNRVAVFGSFAASSATSPRPLTHSSNQEQDSGYGRLPPSSPAATAVNERIRVLLAAKAPAIARPILDRALAAGTITDSERSDLLGEFAGTSAAVVSERSAVAHLHREILAAVGRAAPALAKPLLKEAVASERLTAAQERRILERLRLCGG
jgi:hypothetical protein